MDVSLLKGNCRVRLQNNPDSPEVFPCSECKVLRRGKGNRDNQQGEQVDKKALNKLKD